MCEVLVAISIITSALPIYEISQMSVVMELRLMRDQSSIFFSFFSSFGLFYVGE